MPAQHQVDAGCLQHGKKHLAHIHQLRLAVRIMRSFAVGWMMPEGDDPILRHLRKVGLQPRIHRAVGGAIHVVGIQTYEMDVGVVE